MDLSGIISISGMTGLYKVMAQTKNGLIVESITEKKRVPTYANHKVSALDEITMYTTGEDIALKDVFSKMFATCEGKQAIDPKSADAELRAFFAKVVTDYDKDRVYTSDIKKVISWYNILQAADLLKEKAEDKKEKTEKGKVKAAADDKTKKVKKTVVKDVKAKPIKGTGPKKTQTTRKTGVA